MFQVEITKSLAHQLIAEQFSEYADLAVTDVEKQGHDNRTYKIGEELLIRLPTAESYALKVAKEQDLLPKLARHLNIAIPTPVHMGRPSATYPYPFSIYKWLPGKSINLLTLTQGQQEQLAVDLAKFLKSLQAITDTPGPPPGQHNWWRGDHIHVYNQNAREQIEKLKGVIDTEKALDIWQKACCTKWNKPAVWIHGDVAVGNIVIHNGMLSAMIDFGGTAVGDPACDLVIAWTYFFGKAQDIFMKEMNLDADTWLRARAWALWKATFELCQMLDKNSPEALVQRKIIDAVIV